MDDEIIRCDAASVCPVHHVCAVYRDERHFICRLAADDRCPIIDFSGVCLIHPDKEALVVRFQPVCHSLHFCKDSLCDCSAVNDGDALPTGDLCTVLVFKDELVLFFQIDRHLPCLIDAVCSMGIDACRTVVFECPVFQCFFDVDRITIDCDAL